MVISDSNTEQICYIKNIHKSKDITDIKTLYTNDDNAPS